MTSKTRAKQFRASKRKATVLPQLIIIICEGKNTEIDYFGRWKEEIGKKARFVIEQSEEGTAPPSIVKSAIIRMKEMSSDKPVIWCVGDRDDWPKEALNNAIQRAKSKGFGYVLSVPCLELWFILHYRLHTRPDHRDDVQSLSESLLPTAPPSQSSKSLNRVQLDDLHARHLVAIANAENLDRLNNTAGTQFPINPSSNMHELVHYLLSL